VAVVRERRGRGFAGAGLGLAVLSAGTFGTSGTFADSLIRAGWSPAAAVTVRIALSAAFLTIPALISLRGRWALLRRDAAKVALYGLLAVAGCQLFYFNALERIPVGVALLLEYLGSVLVVGWVWLRHGERPSRLTVAGAAAAVAGLVMVLNLTGSVHVDPIGLIWGLLAACGLAAYFVISASASGAPAGGAPEEPLPPIAMAWGAMCLGALTLAVLGFAGALPLHATNADVHFLSLRVSWIVPVLGLSLIAAVIAYVAGIGAARRLGAKLASFIGMTEVLFAILFAWLALGQLPTPIQFAGGAFILVGIALVRAGEKAPVPVTADEAEVEATVGDPVCEAARYEPSGPRAHSSG